MNKFLIGLFSLMGSASQAHAQSVLPEGVGLFRFGYRSFAPQSEKYGESGHRESLGSSFDKEFSGQRLLQGDGGSDLSRLAQELQRFDGQNRSDESLLNQLDLGTLTGDVEAKVQAQIFGLAYGATPKLTVYGGVPLIKASVQTQLRFSGKNNASKIKQQLGGAAFQELKDGLDQAAKLSVIDIEQSIEKKGYAPIGKWERESFGDVQVGGIYSLVNRRVGSGLFSLASDSSLSLPTGYVDDPDILTDVSFGLGTYAVTQKFIPTMQWEIFSMGGEAALGLPFPGEKQVRLPEAEEGLTEADRKTTARFQPGQSYSLAADLGMRWSWMKSNVRWGLKGKSSDQYSGNLAGNYGKLANNSDSQQTYSELGLGADTTSLYRAKRFPIPFIVNGLMHMPLAGKNATDEKYFELSVTAFFKVPGAGREVKFDRPGRSQKTANRN